MKLGLIVEGHGEVRALPLLVRRIAVEVFEGVTAPAMEPPLRIPRTKLVKEHELQRAVELVSRRMSDAPILVLLDSDDDAPCRLGPCLLAWAQKARSDRRHGVVLAVREFEAWFLASARSLRNQRGLPPDLCPPPRPEAVRDAKGWLAVRMPAGYSETIDQPALAAVMDLQEARSAASFRKLVRDLARLWDVAVPQGYQD